MTDHLSNRHAPAVKVGGRRLSVSKPRPQAPQAPVIAENNAPNVETDYPRPNHEEHAGDDEPKKEKEKKNKHGNHDNERKPKDTVYSKLQATQPTHQNNGNKPLFGGGGRIAQPVGKAFGI